MTQQIPALPEGFTLDQPAQQQPQAQQQNIPALPAGFTIDQVQQAPVTSQPTEVPKPFTLGETLQGDIEVGLNLASGAVGEVAGGLAGLFALPFKGEDAADTTRAVQDFFTREPKTRAGKQFTQQLGGAIESGVKLAKTPLAGVMAAVSLLTGEGTETAKKQFTRIQEEDLGKSLGDDLLELGAPPSIAAMATAFPTAVADLLGFFGARTAIRASAENKGQISPNVGEQASVIPGLEATKDVSEALFNFQTPTKQKIAQLIQEGSTDVETAKFKLAEGEAFKPKTKLGQSIASGKPKAVIDKAAKETVKQGFDEGVIAAIKGASDTDKTKLIEMVDIMEKTKKNKKFALNNRPSDVAGNTLMNRFRAVQDANKEAGRQLDKVATNLKGQFVDHSPAINSFIDDLESIGVSLVKNETGSLKPVFKGSDIEGLAGPELAVNRIVNRLLSTDTPDAHSMHRIKRFIDEQVSFGKNAEGLTGRTELILKNLRRNLDGILDEKFPDYNEVNTVYAETIGAIDSLQDVAGRKMNLTGPNADKAVGTLLRRLMSNAQSRVSLLDSITEIDGMAKKHGGFGKKLIEAPESMKRQLKEDLLTQVLFVDELDRVFGPVARTSFQGQIDQALKQGARAVSTKGGAVDLVVSGVGKVAEKARGINEAAAFKSIKELLKGAALSGTQQ